MHYACHCGCHVDVNSERPSLPCLFCGDEDGLKPSITISTAPFPAEMASAVPDWFSTLQRSLSYSRL